MTRIRGDGFRVETMQVRATKPITLEDLSVMIQMNGQKYVKLMKH